MFFFLSFSSHLLFGRSVCFCCVAADSSSSAHDDVPLQHYYPPDDSIPGRVPDFYFNLSVIYFVLITIGAILCYPYDKNDQFWKTVANEEQIGEEDDDTNEDGHDETHALVTSKSSPSPSSARKSFLLESEGNNSDDEKSLLDVLDTAARPEHSAPNFTLELSPYDLIFEPMCYIFEMCMVFTNVGGR
jgi:hypothetical protein